MRLTNESSVTILCAPELVFDFVALRFLTTWRSWNPDSVDLRAAEASEMRVGKKLIEERLMKRGKGPKKPVGRTIEVTELTPTTTFTFEGLEDHPMRDGYRNRMTFVPLANGTLVTWMFEQEVTNLMFGPFQGVARFKIKLQMRARLKALKKLLEGT